MEQSVKNRERAMPVEEESSFDIMEWLARFAAHWYLFIISLIIAFGLSYLQNRKWLPVYKSTGSVNIDDSRTMMNSTQVMMQGFGVQDAYRNISNQIIMLGSYDLLGRVADAYAFAEVADVNLFIVRSDKTHKQFLRTLTVQLKAVNVHNFYSVLNDVEMKANSYSRYYSRKYAYGNRLKKKKTDGTYFQYYQDDAKEI